MNSSSDDRNTYEQLRLNWFARMGVVPGAAAILLLIAGCPTNETAPTTCTSNVQCVDNSICTNDSCDPDNEAAGTDGCVHAPVDDCCASDDDCSDGEVCDVETNTCVTVCLSDAECDDGDVCNGAEACVGGSCVGGDELDCDDDDSCTNDSCEATTGCVNEPVDCDDQVCDPADGECVECLIDDDCPTDEFFCLLNACIHIDPCETDADCDDGDPCNGVESCDDGLCAVGTTPSCGDGDLCTVDSCDADDPDAGADGCVNEPVDCGDQVCNPDDGECVECLIDDDCPTDEVCANNVCEPGIPCDTDADCPDDGLFCTGVESCDVESGYCVSSGDPCPMETDDPCESPGGTMCNEEDDLCDFGGLVPDSTFDFTLGPDSLMGTSFNDIIHGGLVFNAPTGTNVPSVQTGDMADGGDCIDMVNMTFNFGVVTTVAPIFTSIEILNITDFGTAATTLDAVDFAGTTDVNLSNSSNTNAFIVANLADVVNLSLSSQAVGATVVLDAAATAGSMDEATISVNGITGGTITYTTGTDNGLETLNVSATGAASSFADIAMNGTTLTTINVTGDADLTITSSLDTNVETANASAASGSVNLTQTNAGNLSFTGGSGDDAINLGGTYTSLDVLDGGEGSDTLRGTTTVLGGTAAVQNNVTSFEELAVTDSHVTALNASHFGAVTSVTLEAGSNGGSVTNLPSDSTVSCGALGTNALGTGTLSVTISGSGTSDALTYMLNDCDQNGAVVMNGVEMLGIESNVDLDGSPASGGSNVLGATLTLTNTGSTEQITVTGTEALTMTGAVTAEVLDASGFAHALTMGAAGATSGMQITGGSGNDTLFGSSGADTISAGAGGDIMNPLAGNDLVTGGAGADTFRQSSAAANGADRQTITDFDDTPTTGDVFNFNSGIATLTGTDNFASSATIQTHSAAGNLTVSAATEIVVVTSATVSDLSNASSLNGTNLLTAIGGSITGSIAGQNDILICVGDANGDVGVYYATSADNSIISNEITLVAVLQGPDVAIGDLVPSNFSNAP